LSAMEEACMKDFRRSVFRLFLATFFLLFIAWIGMKAAISRGL